MMKKLLLIFLLLPFLVKAQTYQQMPQSGYGPIKRMLYDSVLTLPMGIASLRNITGGRDTGQIRYSKTDSSVYIYTGFKWLQLAKGVNLISSGIDSVTLSGNLFCQWIGGSSTCYRITKFYDSSSNNYNSTKIIYWSAGVAVDSIGASVSTITKVGIHLQSISKAVSGAATDSLKVAYLIDSIYRVTGSTKLYQQHYNPYRLDSTVDLGAGGTVTNVAQLTLGTTGTDLTSTVTNGTTTPVITLQVPTASASNRGALSSTDWSTFNGKMGFIDTSLLVHKANIETITGAKTFNNGKLILAGATSGTTTLIANNVAGSGTVNLPLSGSLATIANAESLTNKDLTSSNTFPTFNQSTTGNAATATNLTGLTTTVSTLNNQSGINTGDNSPNTLYSGLVSNATHTGDATGATALTLATVNSNVGSFGTSTSVPTFTVNGKGLITAASATAIPTATTGITGLLTSTDYNTFNGKQAAGTYLIPSDTVNKYIRPIAGTNLTITGTYPNLTFNATASGSGTVGTVSVVTANGLSGTVSNPTTSPAITLSTTITGILKGNGTAMSAATAGTDYGRVDSVRFVNSGLIHAPIATYSLAGNTAIVTQTLNNQSPYTLLGRGSGTGVPSFLASIDSNWVTGLHSQTYYDGIYLQNITGLVTAGTNITVTGSGTSGSPYVVNSTGGSAGTTSEQVLTATAAQTAFTFTSVPASYNDYMIIVNGGVGASTTAFTTSGNIVTTTSPLDAGDVVILRRIK